MKPDRIILVFDADSGIGATIGDVIKKLIGREDCTLCAITYSPIGKRRAWRECVAQLGVAVEERHRDQLPAAWPITRAQLPCILASAGDALPSLLLDREAIAACADVAALAARLRAALA